MKGLAEAWQCLGLQEGKGKPGWKSPVLTARDGFFQGNIKHSGAAIWG